MSDNAGAPILTIRDALRWGRVRLAATDSDSPGLDADILLRHALGLDRTALFVHLPDPIEPAALATYRRLLRERAKGLPIAYLTGEREFMRLPFLVDPAVLIPRPETEILVEWALQWLSGREDAVIVDVGAGSGAIALSLAALLPDNVAHRIIAVDVSGEALAIAARNRHHLGLENRVELRQGSLLVPIAEPVDLLLANLPYLRPGQIDENAQLAAEPRLALDGGSDGLDLIGALLAQAPRVLAAGGAVGLEIDPAQRQAVIALAQETFPGSAVRVLPDLAGFDRHVTIVTDRAPTRP